MLLKSPLLKIVGTSKKDCAFIRNYNAKIGDIVQFEYNISNIYASIYVTFVNKDKPYKAGRRYEVNRLNLHNFENYIKTEVVTGQQSKQETFEL